jgi:hypothetical protein
MASININKARVVLELSHQEAGKLSDLLAAEAASQPWAEELFNVMAGDGGRDRGNQQG